MDRTIWDEILIKLPLSSQLCGGTRVLMLWGMEAVDIQLVLWEDEAKEETVGLNGVEEEVRENREY